MLDLSDASTRGGRQARVIGSELNIAGLKMCGKNRTDIKPGTRVQVVRKEDQRTGKLTEGIVQDILTKSATHPHGIKVRLTSGVVGRVKKVLSKESEH